MQNQDLPHPGMLHYPVKMTDRSVTVDPISIEMDTTTASTSYLNCSRLDVNASFYKYCSTDSANVISMGMPRSVC